MEQNTFSPKIAPRVDSISSALLGTARFIMIVMMGLLPFFFIPSSPVFISITKVFFVVLMLLAVVIISSLGILRNGSLILSISPVLLAWWAVVLGALISAILSPTLMSSLVGNSLEIQTVGFLALLGLVMTATVIFSDSKKGLVYVYSAFILGAVLLSILQLIHIFISVDVLSFGFLQENTATILGSLNDLGIFLCLGIILLLVTLIQLPLPKKMVALVAIFVIIILSLLAIINFLALWVVLALFSLALLMYNLTKGRYGVETDAVIVTDKISLPVTVLIALVFIVSTVFLVGGSSLGGFISSATNVNYIEVRPSVTATLDIMRHVYYENAFTGIGPNRFADAWNLYKDTSINQTIFWNTLFSSGSGYIPTWFVTTGIFGVLTWFIFLVLFLYTGLKMLTQGQTSDRFWYYIGTISFVSALFVWTMAIIYVSGPVILIIGAFSTGVMLVARKTLLPGGQKVLNLLTSARTGFVLIFTVIVIIIASISIGYTAVQQFIAYNTYASIAKIPADDKQLDAVHERLNDAYTIFPTDIYARDLAGYQLFNINYLLTLPEPTVADQKKFQDTFTAGIEAAKTAVRINPYDARNWSILGDIFATLAVVKIEGAADNAEGAYNEARKLDPKNPYYDLQEAVVSFRTGDNEAARAKAIKALQLKQNYTNALFLVSQIDIASGDIKKAIATTEALVSFDASNPGRYYQLGVLQSADGNLLAAINSFTQAITLNPTYANALYLRAKQYLANDEKDKAIADLTIVQNLNPDNGLVVKVIDEIKQGNTNPSIFDFEAPITEPISVVTENEVTTTNEATETDLVTPVNVTSNEKLLVSPTTEADPLPTTTDEVQ